MAVGSHREVFVLKGRLKFTIIAGLILAVLVGISVQVVFDRLESMQAEAITTVIGTLLRDESAASKSYLVAQSLEDMRSTGAIQCVRLSRKNGAGFSVFYDSTFQEDCRKIKLESVTMQGLDGETWNLSLLPKIPVLFHVIKWTTLSALLIAIATGVWGIQNILSREDARRQRLEVRRKFLEELADQVRHDVASPISALRVIAERAPLEADTKAFLKQAVERTRGIFESLNQASVEEEAIDISLEVSKVIAEKKLIRGDLPQISTAIPALSLHLPKADFCRVLSNLIDNAIEAGAQNIRITGERVGHYFILALGDDGTAIPAQVIERLGQRGNTFGKAGGSGLGLYQSTQFMQSVGGELNLSNKSAQKISLKFGLDLVESLS